MNNFGQRCKKGLRKVSNIFSHCFCPDHKYDKLDGPFMKFTPENLQLLLLKNLQTQVEDREFHLQLLRTLAYLTKVVEQFSKDLHHNNDPYPRLEDFSKFSISIFEQTFIRCRADLRSKSLLVLKDQTAGLDAHKSISSSSVCQIHPKGHFGGAIRLCRALTDEKSIQSSIGSTGNTKSKRIQTQFHDLFGFDVTEFKIGLLKHIRSLKQDVITLRQLIFSVEDLNIRNMMDVMGNNGGACSEGQFGCKFFEAKIRASNFVRFYKLRKGDGRKKAVRLRKSS